MAAINATFMQISTTEDVTLVASGLTEDKAYVMRVAAKNSVGVGEFTEVRNVVPKCPFGTHIVLVFVSGALCHL